MAGDGQLWAIIAGHGPLWTQTCGRARSHTIFRHGAVQVVAELVASPLHWPFHHEHPFLIMRLIPQAPAVDSGLSSNLPLVCRVGRMADRVSDDARVASMTASSYSNDGRVGRCSRGDRPCVQEQHVNKSLDLCE